MGNEMWTYNMSKPWKSKATVSEGKYGLRRMPTCPTKQGPRITHPNPVKSW